LLGGEDEVVDSALAWGEAAVHGERARDVGLVVAVLGGGVHDDDVAVLQLTAVVGEVEVYAPRTAGDDARVRVPLGAEPAPGGFGVGLDVHDVGPYNVPLEPGMVFSVEPGITLVSEGFRIGIEDVVLVTPNGAENLSVRLPRRAEDIEAHMRKTRRP